MTDEVSQFIIMIELSLIMFYLKKTTPFACGEKNWTAHRSAPSGNCVIRVNALTEICHINAVMALTSFLLINHYTHNLPFSKYHYKYMKHKIKKIFNIYLLI